jgi:hypothetical protein
MVEKFLEEASLLWHESSAWATRLQECRYRSAAFPIPSTDPFLGAQLRTTVASQMAPWNL